MGRKCLDLTSVIGLLGEDPIDLVSQELCYILMWPVVYSPQKHSGGPWGGSKYTEEKEKEFWRPKCISFEDYSRWGGRARDPEHQFSDVPWINDTGNTLSGA